ncbi:hypothetical protein L873DRAFT_1798750 [Choiromyces venosus 120613-1]|uniref:Uncharacterized protein n=1 Tax=Choiromyces venosus 120613-1 TaxID=1336337 RepID=A0A3N4KGA5_9PEZI|nr:hypothetical protein L873DRAFT_1798750 [Choiromyces venosus 120613-1]
MIGDFEVWSGLVWFPVMVGVWGQKGCIVSYFVMIPNYQYNSDNALISGVESPEIERADFQVRA